MLSAYVMPENGFQTTAKVLRILLDISLFIFSWCSYMARQLIAIQVVRAVSGRFQCNMEGWHECGTTRTDPFMLPLMLLRKPI